MRELLKIELNCFYIQNIERISLSVFFLPNIHAFLHEMAKFKVPFYKCLVTAAL